MKVKKFILFISLFFLIGCSNNKINYKKELNLLAKHPHNTESFTQGLFFHDGKLYETTGLYGESKIYKNINLDDNSFEKEYKFDKDVFAEGSTIFKDKLYVLTWKEKKILVFNKDTLELEKELPYEKEGWGLTTDGEYLISSDGTSNLYYLDENANIIKTISANKLYYLNELEYIDGKIWANIYMSNYIAVIDPNDIDNYKMINFDGLYENTTDVNSVLNGIAYNNGRIFITGKKWNTIFEFQLKR